MRAKPRQPVFFETELLQRQQGAAVIQNAHDDILALHRRHHGDAEIDVGAADLQLKAPVLQTALVGDVHAGHDLEAMRKLRPMRAVQRTDLP